MSSHYVFHFSKLKAKCSAFTFLVVVVVFATVLHFVVETDVIVINIDRIVLTLVNGGIVDVITFTVVK